MFQSAGGVEAGGRNATVPGGRGEPERGGSQQTQGPAGVGYPAGEQAHQDSPAGEQGAAGGSGGAPGSTAGESGWLFNVVIQNALELIMSKYRQHVTRLVNCPKPDFQGLNNRNIQVSQL